MKKLVRFISYALVLCILTAFFAPCIKPLQKAEGAALKITLDPGHGGSDPGTSAAIDNGGSHYESWYNLEIAKATKSRLEKYGVTVYMTRTADTAVSLSDRVDIAVNNGSDTLVSIHNNSAGSSAYGSVVCAPTDNYRPAMGKKSTAIAEKILAALAESPGTRNRGILKESYNGLYYPDGSAADYYAINRYAKQRGLSAAMIVECGFCTNAGDVALLEKESSRTQMGYSIADGIAKYYGLKLAEDKPAVPKYKATIKTLTGGGKVGFNESYSLSNLSDLTDGSVVSFNVKADSGYKCTSINVNNVSVSINGNGTGAASYQTKISGKDVSITVSFTKISYNLGVYRVTTDSLNVREQPNANDGTKILGAFKTGDRFTVTEIVNTHWGKVVYNGKIGYISIHLNYAVHVSDLIIESNDIVFDNEESVKWAGSSTDDSEISLYTDQTTEDVFLKVNANSSGTCKVDFRFDKLGSMYADKYKYLLITCKAVSGGKAELKLYTNKSSSPVVKTVNLKTDGLWHNYMIDLSGNSAWNGEIKNIEFTYTAGGSLKTLYLRSLQFLTAKASEPEVKLSDSSMDLAGSIKITYKGLDGYFGTNDNIMPFIAVYSEKSDYLGEPLFKKYISDTTGTFTFSAESTDCKLDEGKYHVRLGYDAKGPDGKNINLRTVFFYSDLSFAKLTVEKTILFENGLYQVYIPRVPTGVVLLRANPADYSVVKAAIPVGEKVMVSAVYDEWGFVSYRGISGWVNIVNNMNYISDSTDVDDAEILFGDINKDYSVDVADIVDMYIYKKGGGTLSEKYLIDSGICMNGQRITLASFLNLYEQIV